MGDQVEEIQALLAQGNLESASSRIHTSLLQMLVDVVPFAEERVRDEKSKTGIYQINALSSMILETLNSARAGQDRGLMCEHLLERIYRPMFRSIAESIVDAFLVMENDLSTAMTDERRRDAVRKQRDRLADTMNGIYADGRDKIQKFLAG